MQSRSAFYLRASLVLIIAMVLTPLATPAHAADNQPPTLGIAGTGSGNVHYVDWLSANPGAGTASGVITLPGGATVNLTFSATAPSGSPQSYAFAQTGCGANFWSPSAPYISTEVPNAPPPCDLLALQGGTNTIYRVSLSQPIRDPIMSIVSLGSPSNFTTYDFDSPFAIVSQGTGYWGGNSTTLQQLPGDILRGNEGHGTIKFLGTFSTFSWTVPTPEYWHGFTFAIRATESFDITPNEGQTAANSGTWGDADPGDTVTLSASVGTIIASPDGTWAWSFATSDGPAESQTVTITATDSQGASTSRTFTLVVRNLAPAATLANDGPVNIGSPATISFSGQADPSSVDAASLHYAYSCTGASLASATYAGSSSSPSSTCVFLSGGNKTVRARVIDKDGGFAEYTTVVTVTNLAPPTVEAGGPYSVNEGGSVTLNATGSDPLGGALTYAWDLDDDGTFETPGQSVGFSASALDGPTTKTVWAKGCTVSLLCSTDSAALAVANVAPVPTLSLSAPAINEGQSATLSVSFTDPGVADSHTVVISWGDGTTTSVVLAAGVLTYGIGHPYPDDDPTATASDLYTVSATVTDDDGASGSASTQLTVSDVAPVLGAMSAPLTPIQVGTLVTVSAPFTDVGTLDTFVAVLDWGDGSSSAATTAGGVASGTHAYASPGLYTVTLIVTDDDGLSSTARSQSLVIIDPNGGFVTGGGWMESPAGAYAADRSLAGRANLGFVAKYKPGSVLPDGNLEFQFKAGDLNFKSTSLEWLIVAGAKAQYEATGTINGMGSYSAIVTVLDGSEPGGAGIDRLRVQITGPAGVIYDSQTTTLRGGNLVIHR